MQESRQDATAGLSDAPLGKDADSGEVTSRAKMVRRIRDEFGVTQKQLAKVMATSVKTVQSYEQGWRNVPPRALLQLFVLLAIHRRRQVDLRPCWEIRNCAPEDRADCPSHAFGDGQFCWLVCGGAGNCHCESPLDTDGNGQKLLPCMDCAVTRQLLQTNNVSRQPAPRLGPGGSGPEK